MRELATRENGSTFGLIAHEEHGGDELRVDVAHVRLTRVALKQMRELSNGRVEILEHGGELLEKWSRALRAANRLFHAHAPRYRLAEEHYLSGRAAAQCL